MAIEDEWGVDDVQYLTISTPESDALESLSRFSHEYYDPKDPDPAPTQIVKRTTELSASEAREIEEARSKIDKLPLKASNILTMLKVLDTAIPQKQKVKYGQVDMYMDEGDISACLKGLINASAVESIYCTHPDQGLASSVNETFELTDTAGTMREIAYSYEYYGSATACQVWEGEQEKNYVGSIVLNPKNVAVTRNTGFSITNLSYRPTPEFIDVIKSASDKGLWYWAMEEGWDEFLNVGLQAVPLRKETTSHMSNAGLAHVNYGSPRISQAARSISTRQIMEDMRRSTIEGVKNQIIVIKLENPTSKEITKMNSLVRENKNERISYIVWRDNLSVEYVLPGKIDELLATETWEQINISVFRNLNVPIYVTGDTNGADVDPDVVKQSLMMLLLQASDIQLKIRQKFLAQWCNMFNASRRLSRKNYLRPSHFVFVPTAIDAAYRIQQIVQPLATFGLVSRETAALWSGLRWDTEFAKILREHSMGVADIARPFSSFSQDSPSGRTESISKPGRTPDRINPGVNVPGPADEEEL